MAGRRPGVHDDGLHDGRVSDERGTRQRTGRGGWLFSFWLRTRHTPPRRPVSTSSFFTEVRDLLQTCLSRFRDFPPLSLTPRDSSDVPLKREMTMRPIVFLAVVAAAAAFSPAALRRPVLASPMRATLAQPAQLPRLATLPRMAEAAAAPEVDAALCLCAAPSLQPALHPDLHALHLSFSAPLYTPLRTPCPPAAHPAADPQRTPLSAPTAPRRRTASRRR